MNNRNFDKSVIRLANAISSIGNIEQCIAFLSDLCTNNELVSMSKRLEIARLLKEGCVFSEIATKTGASNGDIIRVKHSLDYGNGGFDIVLNDTGDNYGTIQ